MSFSFYSCCFHAVPFLILFLSICFSQLCLELAIVFAQLKNRLLQRFAGLLRPASGKFSCPEKGKRRTNGNPESEDKEVEKEKQETV